MVDLKQDIMITRQDSSLNFRKYRQLLFDSRYLYWKDYLKVRDFKNEEYIENDKEHGVPPMNLIFYRYYKSFHEPPPYKVFMEDYKKEFVVQAGSPNLYAFNDGYLPHCNYTVTMPEIDRKILNGYMSFLKEGFVLHWLWENGFPEAYYSIVMDKCGFDICIERHGDCIYGIRVYCKTDDAVHFCEVKDNERLVKMSKIVSIKFEIEVFDKNTRVMAGDTCVASIDIMQSIANLIKLDCDLDFIAYSAEKVNLTRMEP